MQYNPVVSNTPSKFTVKIKRVDSSGDKRYVEGVVYAPYEIDTWKEMMRPEDIETLAFRFMEEVTMAAAIDTKHDNKPNGSQPVQSYIARANDPNGYPENAWILGVVVKDDDLWEKVKKGDISGFSFEAYVTKKPAVVTLEYYPQIVGETEESNGHKHYYVADLDEFGRVIRGWTSNNAGHSHAIVAGTATEETDGHSHRFFL